MNIPTDIYEQVRDFGLGIVNAIEAGDEVLADSLRQTMRAYYEEQTSQGRSHPFLTEAMADYTEDAIEAARLYALALQQSPTFPDEPTHTKMICLAERLIELGKTEQAEAYLRDGLAEAIRQSDNDYVQEAEALLKELRSDNS